METMIRFNQSIPNEKLLGYEELKARFVETGAWGLLSCIDLHECDSKTIRDPEAVKEYVVQLCSLIEMRRFGECVVVNFGEDERVAGLSMTQLIETSLISGHFANLTNSAYIDIFSCKFYNPYAAAEFTRSYFSAGDYTMQLNLRR
ncbi:MAG: S-adenosylmethionine decarboxylase [Spirochaetales bacterium]|nr:S-adenosylmethionine decarboxylase [Spirochaetales bacterium]